MLWFSILSAQGTCRSQPLSLERIGCRPRRASKLGARTLVGGLAYQQFSPFNLCALVPLGDILRLYAFNKVPCDSPRVLFPFLTGARSTIKRVSMTSLYLMSSIWNQFVRRCSIEILMLDLYLGSGLLGVNRSHWELSFEANLTRFGRFWVSF